MSKVVIASKKQQRARFDRAKSMASSTCGGAGGASGCSSCTYK